MRLDDSLDLLGADQEPTEAHGIADPRLIDEARVRQPGEITGVSDLVLTDQPDRDLTVELCETHDMRAAGDRGHPEPTPPLRSPAAKRSTRFWKARPSSVPAASVTAGASGSSPDHAISAPNVRGYPGP